MEPRPASLAKDVAENLLAEALPRRWQHVCAVAAKAQEIAPKLLTPTDAQTLVCAAWLHDIGYAPSLAKTGFHPLDGANGLRAQGYDDLVVGLVAYHSCSELEAQERGLPASLYDAFAKPPQDLSDALLYADMTTGPDGQTLTVEQRMDEIVARYGADHPVSRFIETAKRPAIIPAAQRVLVRLQQK